MKRHLWILLLRLAALVLDRLGYPHNFRRRIGQLTRSKRVGAASNGSTPKPHHLASDIGGGAPHA